MSSQHLNAMKGDKSIAGDIRKVPSFNLLLSFSNSYRPPLPMAPERIMIPIKIKNLLAETGFT